MTRGGKKTRRRGAQRQGGVSSNIEQKCHSISPHSHLMTIASFLEVASARARDRRAQNTVAAVRHLRCKESGGGPGEDEGNEWRGGPEGCAQCESENGTSGRRITRAMMGRLSTATTAK